MKLSFYLLTHNSERYLKNVLQSIQTLADEIVVVDSGSRDHTLTIAKEYKCRLFTRHFDTFAKQRQFALEQCSHTWVLSLDSDEILDSTLIREIQELKSKNFLEDDGVDSFYLRRKWFVMKKEVRALYPVSCPDSVVRLFNKEKGSYKDADAVHENLCGIENRQIIENGYILHHTFEEKDCFKEKIQQYTTLAALDALRKGKKSTLFFDGLHALGAWFKWYFLKGSYQDGYVGWLAGLYAYQYTRLKYKKLRSLQHLEKASSTTHN